ncbi:MAG: DUF2931 family protein [Dyella sp.]|uniref:DUF2931 family protein n=1 Tax=Dyella sp. TaxID=1869338 RepID=UPI003F81932E
MKPLVCLATALLAGCAALGSPRTGLPYDAWRLGFLAPSYMEVWLETADVEDVQGRIFHGAMSGTVAINYSGDPTGWPQPVGWGKGRNITGGALPQRIYVRWQSLAEPQTYRAVLHIPASARQRMREKAPSMRPPIKYEYQEALAIGLAPGGWIRAWVMSPSSTPVEILCQKAEIEPKGPDEGRNQGQYAYAFDQLEPAAQRYITSHPIPYESWKCPAATASVQ